MLDIAKDNSLWIPVYILLPTILVVFVAFKSAKKNFYDKKEQERMNDFIESVRSGSSFVVSPENKVQSRKEFHAQQFNLKIIVFCVMLVLFLLYKYFFGG